MRAARVPSKVMTAVLTVLVSSGCALVASPPDDDARPSSEETSQASESAPTGEPGREPVDPEAFPLAFDGEAKTVFPESPVYDGQLVGTRLVTMTLDQLRARSLPELDTSWQMAPVGLFVDIETQDEQLYALDLRVVEGAGTRAGRLAMTLSRISPATGAVLDEVSWEKTQDVQSSGDPVVKIAAILDDVVVVESSGGDEGSRRTLTAVDLAAGEELWTRRPGSFVGAEGDTVVLETATSGEAGSLVAVDATTGRARWTGPGSVATVDLVGVLDDTMTAVVRESADADPEVLSLSLDDGSVSGRTDTRLADWSCHPTDGTVVVCSLPGERALGFDLATAEEVWQLPTAGRYGVWVSSVRGDYVYGFTSGGRSVVLDAATGRDVTETAGAAPVSSNGYGGLIFYSGQAIFYPAEDDESQTSD
jgi:outer membrane protein assembly factor BamB